MRKSLISPMTALRRPSGSPTRGRPCSAKLTRRLSAIAVRSSLSSDSTRIPQRPKQFDERRKLVVRVQAAWIRQHPDSRTFKTLRLRPNGGVFQGKGVAVGADAEKGEGLRAVAPHLCREAFAAGDKFQRLELVCGRGAAVHQVGDPVAAGEQLGLLGGVKLPVGEAGKMQRRPEAVARTGEVMAGRGRIQARVDADEQDLEARR